MPRRGPDDRATEALIELLSRYSVTAAPAPTDVYRAFSRAPLLSSGMRLVSLVELRESDARYAMLTSIDGQGAAHSGRMQAVGANLLVERERLSEEWSPDWQSALRVMPARSGNELGPVREVKWQPSDATDTHAVAAAERLSSFDHVTGPRARSAARRRQWTIRDCAASRLGARGGVSIWEVNAGPDGV